VLEIGDGYRAKNEELGGDGLIFLRAGHVTDTHIDFNGVERFYAELETRVRSKLGKPGDAVVTTKGNSTGRTTFVSPAMPPFVYSPHLSYWRSLDQGRIEGGFLRYWSKGPEFADQLAGMKASTDMAPYLSLVDQKRLHISLPSIAEQRAIAHILGTLDDKIELNRRMNETLEAMARALFKSWFIDFDPVRRNAVRARNQPSPRPSPSGRGHQDYRAGYDFAGLVEAARTLRKKQTPAETIFWELVRDRQFMGLKFRRQHQVGDYIADFYCHEHRLVIELDGGIHSEKRKKDHKRDAWMKAQDLTVLRFPNDMLFDDPESLLAAIYDVVFPSTSGRGAKGEGVVAGEAYDHLFPDSFEDSELGEIPKGWAVGALSDVASLNPESWSKETRPEVINYIDLSNVKWGSIDAVVGYTHQDAPSRAQRVLRSGDTIVGTVRPGNGSYAFINADGLTGSTGFAVLRPHRSEYAQFIYLAATAAENIEALAHLADGGAYPAVRPDVVIATPVIRPRDKVLARFSIFSDSLLAKIAQNECESRTLAALRDKLLPKLITGELQVRGLSVIPSKVDAGQQTVREGSA
jgi:very-short-patch-repair endonuclease